MISFLYSCLLALICIVSAESTKYTTPIDDSSLICQETKGLYLNRMERFNDTLMSSCVANTSDIVKWSYKVSWHVISTFLVFPNSTFDAPGKAYCLSSKAQSQNKTLCDSVGKSGIWNLDVKSHNTATVSTVLKNSKTGKSSTFCLCNTMKLTKKKPGKSCEKLKIVPVNKAWSIQFKDAQKTALRLVSVPINIFQKRIEIEGAYFWRKQGDLFTKPEAPYLKKLLLKSPVGDTDYQVNAILLDPKSTDLEDLCLTIDDREGRRKNCVPKRKPQIWKLDINIGDSTVFISNTSSKCYLSNFDLVKKKRNNCGKLDLEVINKEWTIKSPTNGQIRQMIITDAV
ncbi:hypothetical protein ROZALSC1DRAFT_27624 [Rozella allomycis CSF55]|uniref:Ricin B lectin domain-containing protein n=1 Tax=Rozella allomycis (strain CSF55) TaxID=988480 RepID=A0A4P9YMK4_ROZAC|nr:hypothetical protein ROZALSC1DRAFT_27624 [Rozella allomycis CSF55]